MYQFASRMVDSLHRAMHPRAAVSIHATARPAPRARMSAPADVKVNAKEMRARYASTRDADVLGLWCSAASAQLAFMEAMEELASGEAWRGHISSAGDQPARINASSKIATARVQPADAPRILCGKHEI